jgi:hypothetical protein
MKNCVASAVPMLTQATKTIPIVSTVAFDPVRDAQSWVIREATLPEFLIQQLDLVGKRLVSTGQSSHSGYA